MNRRANPADFVGRVFGTFRVERVELESTGYKKPATFSYAYGHCTICGAPMRRSCASLRTRTPHCVNGCVTAYPAPPETEAFDVIRPVGAPRGAATMWEVRCRACGKLCELPGRCVAVYKSCGCKEEAGRIRGREVTRKMSVEGTNIAAINPARALNKNSRTGIKGVSTTKSGKYRAHIMVGGKQIHLGNFDTLEAAAEARRLGEEKYFSPVIERWEEDGNSLAAVKGRYVRKTEDKPGHVKNLFLAKGKFMVRVTKDHVQHNRGPFVTRAEAIAARDKLRAELGLPPIID